MKSTLRSAVVSLVGILLLAACAKEDPTSPTLPINEKISIEVDLETGRVVQSGYEWVDNSGIIHVQGRVIEGQTVTGDLTGKFKTLILNSEFNPRTGNRKELLSVECTATWPAQKLNGVFAGQMQQEITDGARAASNLTAKGKDGFDKLNLEVTFKDGQASSGVLVGEGRIFER